MISVIIVYNDTNILNSLTFRSLKQQTREYELILIDNIGNQNFSSAAAALNHGANQSTGDYLMFIHQDVDLLDKCFLEKVEHYLQSLDQIGIAGVAGMSDVGFTDIERRRNLIYQDVPKRVWGSPLQSCEIVQTLDECLLIVPRKVFDRIKFDYITCNNWHLYGVDYCLMVVEMGLVAYVVPLPIYHQSAGDSAKVKRNLLRGSLSADYLRSFEQVRRKHRNHVQVIYTTCGSFNTAYPIILQKFICNIKKLLGSPFSFFRFKHVK